MSHTNVMKISRLICAVCCLGAIMLTGCKPTEKNYKAAYDAAVSKKQKEAADPDILIPGGKLISEDAPRTEQIEGREMFVRYSALKLISGEQPLKRYNVAIAVYKMTANAKSHWERMVKDYPAASLLQAPSELFIVSIGGFDNKEEAAAAIVEYEKNFPTMHYVGIDEQHPIIYVATNVPEVVKKMLPDTPMQQ